LTRLEAVSYLLAKSSALLNSNVVQALVQALPSAGTQTLKLFGITSW
jgi:hypothetical protein